MSSSPRRSTPDPNFGEDQATMQEITIGGDAVVNEDGGGTEPSAQQSGPTVLDKGALRRYSAWIALVAASSLSYASLAVESANDKSIGARRFSFAVIGISLLISIGVSGCFIAPDCNPCSKAFVSPSSSTGRFFELFLVRRSVSKNSSRRALSATGSPIATKHVLALFSLIFPCSSRLLCSSCGA